MVLHRQRNGDRRFSAGFLPYKSQRRSKAAAAHSRSGSGSLRVGLPPEGFTCGLSRVGASARKTGKLERAALTVFPILLTGRGTNRLCRVFIFGTMLSTGKGASPTPAGTRHPCGAQAPLRGTVRPCRLRGAFAEFDDFAKLSCNAPDFLLRPFSRRPRVI